MWKSTVLLLCLSGYCCAGPVTLKRNMPIMQRDDEPMALGPAAASQEAKPEYSPAPQLPLSSTLTLPSNATSIRADITDNFSCDNKTYGYYADAENDCQIFHVCLPVTYADGKENTFRWSFICPEDTVFSQESFTCLRREDMTIDCEESFKYYDLNSNFGMIEEETNKNLPASGKPMITNQDEEEQAMAIQAEVQQPMEEKPMPAMIQPMKETKKPMKETKKPMSNRRKPAQAMAVNKKKTPTASAQPLRKAEKPVESTQTVETAPTVEKDVIKPLNNQRFTKRPTTMSTNLKEKLQTPKPLQAVPNRGELFNQIRKRPTTLNKKDAAVVAKPIEEEIAEEHTVQTVQPALAEPVPTLKLETMFTPLSEGPIPAIEADAIAQTEPVAVAIVAPENVAAASETTEVFVKPTEEVSVIFEKTKEMLTEPESTAEQFANVSEDETDTPETPVLTIGSSEQEAIEIKKIIDILTQAAPENVKPELLETTDILEESSKTQGALKPVEAIEEIPAVILEVEEQQPAAADVPTVDNATAMQVKSTNPVEPQKSVIEPSDITSDVLSPSLEELEDAKPADAIEVMDMLVQVPAVQEMFQNTDSLKESSGGFKPVDPLMAAEAEALIVDFLNVLKKSDNTNNKPIYPGESHTSENEEEIKSQPEASNEEEKQLLQITSENEEQTLPAQEAAESDRLKNGAAFSNVLMIHSLPDSMYQIPVQVITSPVENEDTVASEGETDKQVDISVEENMLEADKLENASAEQTGTVKLSNEEETVPQPAINLPQDTEADQQASSYTPLSIDDIVELVKEQLDQVPTEDKQTIPTAAESETVASEVVLKPVDEKNTQNIGSEAIIMPIYHRISPLPAESNLLKAQNLLVNEPTAIEKKLEDSSTLQKAEEEKQEETRKESTKPVVENNLKEKTEAVQVPEKPETQEPKQSRAYRSRSMKNAKMDPRKRRFLFRSDAS